MALINFLEAKEKKEREKYKQRLLEDNRQRLELLNILFFVDQVNKGKIQRLPYFWVFIVVVSITIGYPLLKNPDTKSQTVGIISIIMVFLFALIYTIQVFLERRKIKTQRLEI